MQATTQAGTAATVANDVRPSRLWSLAAAAGAAAAALFVLVGHLELAWEAPLDFHEAYNLQVPLNLWLDGSYQTWYAAPRPFAPALTAGPAVLLPVAALFAALGPSYRVARLVMTAFFIGWLWQAHWLCRHLAGRDGNLLFVAAMLLFAFTPLALLVSACVLGEMPALFLFLSAVRLLSVAPQQAAPARLLAAGATLGLAVLSTPIAALAAVAGLAALALVPADGGHGAGRIGRVVWCAAGILLPIAAWQAAIVYGLGWPGYVAHLDQTWGSLDNVAELNAGAAPQHVAALTAQLSVPAWLIAVALLLVVAASAWTLRRRSQPFAACCVAVAAPLLWGAWLVSGGTGVRHLLPGHALLALLLPYVGWSLARETQAPSAARFACIAALAAAVVLLFPPRWPPPRVMHAHARARDQNDTLLRDQESAAWAIRGIRARIESSAFWGLGRAQAPEISFLARLPFNDLSLHRPRAEEHNYLVTSGSSLSAAALDDYQARYCTEDIYRGPLARVCRLGAGAPRAQVAASHGAPK